MSRKNWLSCDSRCRVSLAVSLLSSRGSFELVRPPTVAIGTLTVFAR